MFPKWIDIPSSVRGNPKRLYTYLAEKMESKDENKGKKAKTTKKADKPKKEEVDADAEPQNEE